MEEQEIVYEHCSPPFAMNFAKKLALWIQNGTQMHISAFLLHPCLILDLISVQTWLFLVIHHALEY